jgi:hypothetical protein
MSITGRNLNVGAKMNTAVIAGDSTAISGLGVSPRSSMKVEELGVTVAGVNDAVTPFDLGAGLIITFRVLSGSSNNLSAFLAGMGDVIATCTMLTSTTSGSKFTTRDGTLAWAAAYQDPSARVFPAGSVLFAQGDGAAAAADTIVVYGATSEFGAPPA